MAHTNLLKTYKIGGSRSGDEDKLFCDVTLCHRVSSSDVRKIFLGKLAPDDDDDDDITIPRNVTQ